MLSSLAALLPTMLAVWVFRGRLAQHATTLCARVKASYLPPFVPALCVSTRCQGRACLAQHAQLFPCISQLHMFNAQGKPTNHDVVRLGLLQCRICNVDGDATRVCLWEPLYAQWIAYGRQLGCLGRWIIGYRPGMFPTRVEAVFNVMLLGITSAKIFVKTDRRSDSSAPFVVLHQKTRNEIYITSEK